MKKFKAGKRLLFVALLALLSAGLLYGCGGSDGATGAPGTSTGTIQGKISDSGTGARISAGSVALSPTVQGANVVVKADGTYTVSNVPIGVYAVTFSAANYTSATVQNVSVVAGQTTTQNEALAPNGATAGVPYTQSGDVSPGGTVSVALTPSTGTVTNVQWSILYGPKDSNGTDLVTVTPSTTDPSQAAVALPPFSAFIAQYFNILQNERGIVEGMDHQVVQSTDPSTGTRAGAVLDRDMIMGIMPFGLFEGVDMMTTVNLQAVVTLSDGSTVTQEVDLNLTPSYTDNAGTWTFAPTTGLGDVPVQVPVLLHGKDSGSGSWSMTAPSASKAQLEDADQQNAFFTPDIAGVYNVTAPDGTVIPIYAGTWGMPDGAIGGVDANGNPTPSASCLTCHNTSVFPDWNDIFTGWASSGHAHVFTDNLIRTEEPYSSDDPYNTQCFLCHTVGYNTTADDYNNGVGFPTNAVNNGFDDQTNYAAMLAKYFPQINGGNNSPSPDNWTNLLTDYPTVASFANDQCESCHGPNNSAAHTFTTDSRSDARFSLSSDVCGRCHGEDDGRVREWQRGYNGKSHANYAVAISEGLRSSCAGCHTGQGALDWFQQLENGNPSRTVADYATLNLTPDNVQPQTCVVCHDPHASGAGSGPTGATVRITGSTPMLPAGFQATGVGKGALCIVCHNSRNGEATSGSGVVALHEDSDTTFGDGMLTKYDAPHEADQGDVMMGRNAYFFGDGEVGSRSPHSFIPDTCVNCHMEQIPGPDDQQIGHDFGAGWDGTTDFCANCHGAGFNRTGVQSATEDSLTALGRAMMPYAVSLAVADTTDNGTLTVPTFNFTTDMATYSNGTVTVTNSNGDTIAFTVSHSGPTLAITPSGGTAVNPTVPFPTAANASSFAEVCWDYALISGDNSLGMHNPGFASDVLTAATTEMSKLNP